MAIIHRTTLTPTKMELLSGWLPTRPWYLVAAEVAEPEKAGGFRLDDPEGDVGIEFMVATDKAGGRPLTYHVPLTYRGAPLDGAGDALIGTTEHGVLGKRWVYDGTRDPVMVHQLVALIQGGAAPQAQSENDTKDPTVQAHAATGASLPRRASQPPTARTERCFAWRPPEPGNWWSPFPGSWSPLPASRTDRAT